MGRLDPTTLGNWFDGYSTALVFYAGHWLGRDAAEDVVQEVFLKLCVQSRPPDAVQAWLFRAVRNACIDRMRRREVRSRVDQQVGRGHPRWFESGPGDVLDAAILEAALHKLPEASREVIILRIWVGVTFAEASQITGESISTLHSRYCAGLAKLRQMMEAPCNKNHSI